MVQPLDEKSRTLATMKGENPLLVTYAPIEFQEYLVEVSRL